MNLPRKSISVLSIATAPQIPHYDGMDARELLWYEWLMLAGFAGGMLIWGMLSRRQAARSLEDAFLAGRKLPGSIASLSTVATNMNANDFIGMAGAIYGMGIVMLHQPLLNALVLAFLGLFVMSRLRGRNAFTLGQWLRERYDARIGYAYSIIWALVWMLFNLGLYIYSGALVMHTLAGWNLYAGIVAVTLIVMLYTLLGGFKTVVMTDVLQLVLMQVPFVVLAVMIWQHTGGPVALLDALPADKSSLWQPETPFGPISLTVGGMLLIAMSYWSSEAQVVQRPLASKDINAAATSYLGASFWYVLLVPFVVFLPALAAITLYPDLANNDFATPFLIRDFIPSGLYGLTIVGLLAGVFSSCDSQINAFCTLFTTDIYRDLIKPGREEQHYLRVSRIAGIVFSLAAIGTAVIFSFASNGMFLFAVGIVATIMPPFGAITILGAVRASIPARAAFIGVVSGMGFAVALFAADLGGFFSGIATDSLYLRSGATFLLTSAVTLLFSSVSGANGVAAPAPARLTQQTRRMALLVALAVLAMYAVVSLLAG